jgi:hypothetical protein
MKGLRKSSRTALRWSVVTATGFSRVMRLSLTPTCCATDAQVYHSEPQVCRKEARKKRMAHPAHGRSRLSRPATPFTSSPLRHCLSTPPPGGPLTHLFFSFPCRLRPSCSVSLALFVFCSLSCPSTCAARRPGFGQRRPATTRSPRGLLREAGRGRVVPPSRPASYPPTRPPPLSSTYSNLLTSALLLDACAPCIDRLPGRRHAHDGSRQLAPQQVAGTFTPFVRPSPANPVVHHARLSCDRPLSPAPRANAGRSLTSPSRTCSGACPPLLSVAATDNDG